MSDIKVVPKCDAETMWAIFFLKTLKMAPSCNTDQSRVYHTILYPITKHLGGRHDIV